MKVIMEITVLTNVKICSLCGAKCCGVFAMWNHIKNNHKKDNFPVKCKCYKIVTDLEEHEKTCVFHGKQTCDTCGMSFKNYDKKMNHYGNSKCKPIKAQGFGDMSEQDIRNMCRDNKLRRRVVMNLIQHTDFYNQNSLLRRLNLRNWPAFQATQPSKYLRSFYLQDGSRVILNVKEPRAQILWAKLAPYAKSMPKAQIGFSIDHNIMLDPQISRLFATLSTAVENLKIDEAISTKILQFVIKMVYLTRMDFKDPLLFSAWIMDILISMNVGKLVQELVLKRVKQFFDVVTAQMFDVSKLFGPILTVVSSVFFGKIPSFDVINSLIRFGNLSRGTLSIWSLAEKIVQKCLPFLYKHFTGFPYEIEELQSVFSDMKEWYSEVQFLIGIDHDREIAQDSDMCRRIERAYRQGLQFYTLAGEMKIDPKIISGLAAHFSSIKRVFEKVERSGAMVGGPKMEPIVIQIYGRSGVGKTHIMTPLALELLKVKGIADPNKWNQEIYNRMPEQEFWDNYNGQRGCIYDDFAQKQDSAQNPDISYFELIRTGNIAACPLHMAALIEKNKTFFTSEFIILTTNTKRLNPESITCPEAVRRRIDFAVEATIQPKYTKSNGYSIDENKVEGFSTDIYRFHCLDPMTGNYTDDPPISYERFLLECVNRYKKKIAKSKMVLDHYNKLAAAPAIIQGSLDMEGNLRERLTNLDEFQIRELVLGLDEYKDFLTEECVREIKEFNPVTVDCTPTQIWDNWREFLFESLEIRPGGFDFIKEIEKEKKQDAEKYGHDLRVVAGAQRYFFGLDKRVETPEVSEDLRSWRSRFELEQLRETATTFGTWSLSWLEKAKEFIKSHPFLTAFITIWPLVSWIVLKKKKEREEANLRALEELTDDQLAHFFTPLLGDPVRDERCPDCNFVRMIYEEDELVVIGPCRCYTFSHNIPQGSLDHAHKGLKKGVRVKHQHDCEDCGKEFTHTHKIKEEEVSRTYPQKCKECMKKFDDEVKLELATIENLPPEKKSAVIIESEDSEQKKLEKILRVEISASGDPKTKVSGKRRVQLMADLSASGDPKTTKPKSGTIQLNAEFRRDNMGFNVGLKVTMNIYNISFYDGSRQFAELRGFFIRGRIMMTVQHALTAIAKSTHIVIWNNQKPDGFKIPVEDLQVAAVKGEDGEFKDQLLIEMPRSIQEHADILDQIATTEEMSRFTETSAVLLTPYRNGVIQRHGLVKARDVPLQYSEGERVLTLRKSYFYFLETKDGDCGSPLLVVNSQIQRKIIGMHVAGNLGGGFSTVFNKSDVEKAMVNFCKSSQVILDVEATAHLCMSTELRVPEGNFTAIGKSEHVVGGVNKTKLRKSLVCDEVVPRISAPAVLQTVNIDGERVDPMMKGLKKCGSISPPLNKQLLQAAVNDMKRKFGPDEVRKRVYSSWESVVGDETDEFAPPIKRTTSAGYPWKFETKEPGKTKWLGANEEYKLDPELEKKMDERVQFAKEGKRYPTIWIDTLKDERRPLDKVAIAKTRVFSAGPMDFTLVFRRYFLGFLAHVSHNRNENEISVGTNVYSPDWTNIALILQSKGKKVIAGDFSNFDGTLHIDILWAVLDVINDWYGNEEDNAVREILWREIVYSIHVCRESIYMWTHSQPSGCPMTAVLNSMYNSIACRYVFMLLTEGTEYHSMKAFDQHVAMVSYGDDNALNISDEIAGIFNQKTMAQAFLTFGMTYTDEVKSGEMVPYRTLPEIQYLKRRFVKDQTGQYIAPLDLSTVLEIGNWVRECADHRAATKENVENLCFELSLHGEEIFSKWSNLYRKACMKRDIPVQILTFWEYRFTLLANYGRITAKTEGGYLEETDLLEQCREEVQPDSTGASTFWESCEGSKARFEKVEWRAQSSIANCVPLKIQANSPPTFEGRSNPASGVCKNERIAATEMNEQTNLEQQQITRFVDDVERTEYVKPGIQAAEEWIKSGSETMNHSIESVLERPVEIDSDEFTTLGFTTKMYKFPDVLFQQAPNIVDKMNKFEFLRADVRVKLLFNATPFQQGKYWLFFSPFDDVSGRAATGSLQNATGYPGVEVDLASGAPVELTIPYCSPMSHYRLTNGESTMGDLVLQELVPITTGVAATTCSFTIMAWFVNVRTSLPTTGDVDVPAPPFRAQMAMDDEEIQQTKEGVISAVSNNVAVAANAVGQALPALSDITTPVSWVARAISGVASTFGFNKPTTVADTHPYVNHPGRGYTNMDGLDNSHKLAACPDNKLTTDMSYFSSTYDEMSIDYIKKKSCIVTNAIDWTLSEAKGDALYAFRNSPSFNASSITTSAPFDPSTVNFLASMFRYWRGGMRYRLSFAKTAFHTGRLRVSFLPSGTSTGGGGLGTAGVNTHNWILDLSKSSELEFTIPYVSNYPWTEVFFDAPLNSSWTPQRCTGTVIIEVLTELRRSSNSVAGTVTGVLWHCGDDDLEFAVPEFNLTVVDNTAPFLRFGPPPESINNAPLENEEVEAKAQIFNLTGDAISHRDQEAPATNSMFPSNVEQGCIQEQMTIGEKVTNLRQLIKRFGDFYRGEPFPYRQVAAAQYMPVGPYDPGNSGNDAFFFNSLVIDPAYFGEKNLGPNGTAVTANLPTAIDATGLGITLEQTQIAEKMATNCPLHYISYLYRFWRGGKRYKIFFPDSNLAKGGVFRVGSSTSDGITTQSTRFVHPVVVKRQGALTRNGVVAGVVYNTLITNALEDRQTFETTYPPDRDWMC
jgi:hypothetical protein